MQTLVNRGLLEWSRLPMVALRERYPDLFSKAKRENYEQGSPFCYRAEANRRQTDLLARLAGSRRFESDALIAYMAHVDRGALDNEIIVFIAGQLAVRWCFSQVPNPWERTQLREH
jgi:hypothetical protein